MVTSKRNSRPSGHGKTSTTTAPSNLRFGQSASYKKPWRANRVLADRVLSCCEGLGVCWRHWEQTLATGNGLGADDRAAAERHRIYYSFQPSYGCPAGRVVRRERVPENTDCDRGARVT